MRRRTPSLFLSLSTLLLLLAALPLAAEEVESEAEWTVRWANGTRIDSADGEVQIVIGGRLHADAAFSSADARLQESFRELSDGNELRRARLFVSGLLYRVVDFEVEYDFAGGEAEPKDVYVGLRDTPVGNLRLGHYKETFSLEELTSDNFVTFIERSVNTVFAPSYNFGLQSRDHVGDRLTWALGAFRDTDDAGEADGESLGLTARLTGLPLYADGGRRLLHLGVAVSTRDPGTEPLRFRARPEAHLAPRFVDTGELPTDRLELIGLELALVAGPFWAAAEWTQAEARDVRLAPSASGDLTFGGGSLQLGYFSTGEHRPYRLSSGTFDRVRPESDFRGRSGTGAWEIALRLSSLDLDDGAVAGGTLENWTLGVNWYLNSAARIMLNYVDSELDGVGTADFVLARFQVDF